MKKIAQIPPRKTRLFMTIGNKIALGSALLTAVVWAALRYLPLIPALAVMLVLVVSVYILVDRLLVRPIQALTLSVLESRPTPNGFEYRPTNIRTGDELELLSDALRRMADDINRKP